VPGDAARLEAVSRAPPPAWDLPALRAALEPEWPGLEVEAVAVTGSTNSDLLERLRRGDASPCLRIAQRQTQGRGRLGRAWHARPGASLAFSLALPLARPDWSGLSLAVGVALAEALDDADPPRLALKWPNDLWLLDAPGIGRKLAGVLIESVATQVPRVAVIGVGLNVAPLESTHDASAEGGGAPDKGRDALPPAAASLAELDPAITAPAALARIAPALLRAVRRFESDGFAALHAAYARRDGLAGHAVRTTLPQAAEGVALGVTPHGALVVRTADGARVEITSGEVSVRPAASALLR
jgi:BirA family biotin operon repressor/biotin-[acetyl-CoA-carboxylase] ligase